MIKIKVAQAVKETIEKKHYKDIRQRFIDEITDNREQISRLKQYLYYKGRISESRLRKLILGKKYDLINIIEEIGEIRKTHFGTKLYSNFSNRNWASKLLKELNIRVCPYCNMQYTFILNKEDRIRPQFDHYFPQGKYPYLQVSLYNLIPSCSTCNMKKGDYDPFLNGKYVEKKSFFYPYELGFNQDINFITKPNKDNDINYWLGIESDFKIDLVINKNLSKDQKELLESKLILTNNKLKIKKIYNKQKDYVRDIIIKSRIYTEEKIDELLDDFPELFSSKESVYDYLLMNYYNEDEWNNRSLAKFSHDIFKEFKV